MLRRALRRVCSVSVLRSMFFGPVSTVCEPSAGVDLKPVPSHRAPAWSADGVRLGLRRLSHRAPDANPLHDLPEKARELGPCAPSLVASLQAVGRRIRDCGARKQSADVRRGGECPAAGSAEPSLRPARFAGISPSAGGDHSFELGHTNACRALQKADVIAGVRQRCHSLDSTP